MYSKRKILLIEDDKSDVSSITGLLGNSGYKVTAALTGNEGLSLAASLCPDAILLNLGLPDMNGYKVLQQLRSWTNVPIIIISTHCKEAEKVMALDSGADDYITKPFGSEELLARIRTALRRQRPLVPDRIYKARELEINFDKSLVRLAGKEIHLTHIEYQLLTLLAENSGRVLKYSEIMNAIWGPYKDSNNQILRVNMSNIRRKIEKDPAKPEYIYTKVGVGYRMLENENANSL